MQSQCLDVAYNTDDNLVVSAPTGSGKTCVMELAIVRLISKQGGDRAKIIYIAPTKVCSVLVVGEWNVDSLVRTSVQALCSERVIDWKKKFRVLGITCGELTGDTESEAVREVQQSNIIVTTPEKWDSMTRRWRDHKQLMELVQLILIDEVHLLNEPRRGAVLEVIVSRMRTVNTECVLNEQQRQGGVNRKPHKRLRILAISATAPNIEDIAVWLKNHDGRMAEIKLFGEEFRPVQLVKHVIGYAAKINTNDFVFDKTLDYKLAEVISRYSNGKPSLVFCATRKSVDSSASQLVTEASNCQIGVNHPFVRSGLHQTELRHLASQVTDKKLADCLPHGIAIHNGSLLSADRMLVEAKFISGQISVICTTSTLSVGVNLPAHLVIIKGTQQYRDTGYAEYSEMDLMQMMGRAGRPQFDDSGVVVIMTTMDKVQRYDNMVSGKEIIESSLHENLIEHLNAEVVLGTIPNVELCIEWLKSTFLNGVYLRMSKNPARYKDPRDKQSSKQMSLDRMCMRDLNLLAQARLIEQRDDGMTMVSTDFGRVMAKYYVRFETARDMIVGIQKAPSMKQLLSVLSNAMELSELKFRNDKTILNALNKSAKYPISGKLKTVQERVNVILQSKLTAMLTLDSNVALKHAERLSRFLFEVSQLKQDFQATDGALELSNSIHARTWEQNGHHLKQIDNVGPVQARMLFDSGVKTIREFVSKTPEQIEILLNKGRLTGNKLLDAARTLPLINLHIVEFKPYGGKELEYTITITLDNPTTAKTFGKKGALYVIFLMGNESENELLDFRKILMKDVQVGYKFMIKFKKRPTVSKLKFIASVEDFVGLTITKFVSVERSGLVAPARVQVPAPIAPIFLQAVSGKTPPGRIRSQNPSASAVVIQEDVDDEFGMDFDADQLDCVDSLIAAAGSIKNGSSSSPANTGTTTDSGHAPKKKRKTEHDGQKAVVPRDASFIKDSSSDSEEIPLTRKSKTRTILPLAIASDSDHEFKSSNDILGLTDPKSVPEKPLNDPIPMEIDCPEQENDTSGDADDESVEYHDGYDEWGDYVAEAESDVDKVVPRPPRKSTSPLFSDTDSPPSRPILDIPQRQLPQQKLAPSAALTELNRLHMKTASSNAGTKPWLFSRPSSLPLGAKRPASPSPVGFLPQENSLETSFKRQHQEVRDLNSLHESSLQKSSSANLKPKKDHLSTSFARMPQPIANSSSQYSIRSISPHVPSVSFATMSTPPVTSVVQAEVPKALHQPPQLGLPLQNHYQPKPQSLQPQSSPSMDLFSFLNKSTVTNPTSMPEITIPSSTMENTLKIGQEHDEIDARSKFTSFLTATQPVIKYEPKIVLERVNKIQKPKTFAHAKPDVGDLFGDLF
ncbi:UNVERIFIED_CONTAM: Sec63 [Siphonaria sp. JEL0065]|nr:Sec63 [Siphonaria sp. JEL0065]